MDMSSSGDTWSIPTSGTPFLMHTKDCSDNFNSKNRSLTVISLSIEAVILFLPMIFITKYITSRTFCIAPSRFELLSTDPKSGMLGHYTTGLIEVKNSTVVLIV